MSADKPSTDKPAASTSKKRTATGAKTKARKGSEESTSPATATGNASPPDQATTKTPDPSDKESQNASLGENSVEPDVDAADKVGEKDKDNGDDGEVEGQEEEWEWESEKGGEGEENLNEKELDSLSPLSENQSTHFSKSDSSQSREKTQESDDDSSSDDDNPKTKDKSPSIGKVMKRAFKPRVIEINEAMTLTLTYKEGDPNSLPDNGDVVRAIREWHIRKAITKNPPFASDMKINRPVYDRQTCFDREGNELERSIFHASVLCIAKSHTGKNETKYDLIILHLTDKTGVPAFFSQSIRMPPGALSWGFEWNTKDQQFQEEAFAVRMYRAEDAPRSAVQFDEYLFKLLKANVGIVQKQLKERAKGWMTKQKKRKRSSSTSKRKSKDSKKVKDEPSSSVSDDERRSRSRSPPRKTRKPKRTYTRTKREEDSDDSEPEKLLNSPRVKLVSGSNASSRIFSLDGCDIKSLFKRAREFYGVKSSNKSFSLLCEISGIGPKALASKNMDTKRFIGESYADEFDILCNDVLKLSISEKKRVEIVAKPGGARREGGGRRSEDDSS